MPSKKKAVTSSYNVAVDLLRIFVGLGVVVIHISTTFVNYPPIFETPAWWSANLLDSAFRIAVPIFILISGYLLLDPKKKDDLKSFYLKKINRVVVPLIIWTELYFVWRLFFLKQTFTFHDIYYTITSMQVYYHLYFLYIIVGLYLITPFLRAMLRKITFHYQILITFVFLFFPIVIAVCNYVVPSFKIAPNAFTIFILYIGYYLAGPLLGKISLKKGMLYIVLGLYLVLSVATSYLNLWQMIKTGWSSTVFLHPNFNRYFYDHFSFNVVLMSLLFFIVGMNFTRVVKLTNSKTQATIKNVAGYVFGIYLVHPMIIDLLNRYVIPLEIHHMKYLLWLMMGVKILIVTSISGVIVFLLKRVALGKEILGE